MDLSVVVPAYREGPHIYDNLQRLMRELDQLAIDYEVVVVSDGNHDATASEAKRVMSTRVTVVDYPRHKGKGYALATGVQRSTGALVTFIDADMELHPREIRLFIKLLREQDLDIVIGSKRHPDSRVDYPMFRRLQSIAYQLLIRALFNLKVRDTQTGLKLFRRHVLEDILPRLAVKQFAFDLELLVVAAHLGYRRIVEAPIELSYRFSSTIRPWTVYKILWDTAAIYYRLHIRKHYDRPLAWAEPVLDRPLATASSLPADPLRRP
jgi:glycosyltransferase involved in cell wall biosynthesis